MISYPYTYPIHQSQPHKATAFSESASPVRPWLVFGGAVFLVAVPVFFEAPLVRVVPWLSLALTAGWLWLGSKLSSKPDTQIWGELITGFAWTWMAGSVYWGWLRWEPTLHLPIEAIALPITLWGLARGRCKVGNLFYLGSLFGTVLTDIYFYLVDLIPAWRQLMQAEPDLVRPIFQQAIAQVNTSWGLFWVAILATTLFSVGVFSFRLQKLHWLAFSGAVLSTILVDGLFWLAASLA
ncbi:DUF3120 domain-containing protein [Phormidesmis priestleyi]